MFSEKFHKFLMNKNLLDALEDAMGTENIALHHTKAHIKPTENGAPYLMHQVKQIILKRHALFYRV